MLEAAEVDRISRKKFGESQLRNLLAVASERREYLPIRIRNHETEYRAVVPGDPGYDSARADIEKGRIRLYP